MAAPIITPTDLHAWLRVARLQPDPSGWLTQLLTDATMAVAANDVFVAVTSFKGQSSESTRNVDARFLQHVAEQCLQVLEAEAAAAAEGQTLPPPNAVRYGSFAQ